MEDARDFHFIHEAVIPPCFAPPRIEEHQGRNDHDAELPGDVAIPRHVHLHDACTPAVTLAHAVEHHFHALALVAGLGAELDQGRLAGNERGAHLGGRVRLGREWRKQPARKHGTQRNR